MLARGLIPWRIKGLLAIHPKLYHVQKRLDMPLWLQAWVRRYENGDFAIKINDTSLRANGYVTHIHATTDALTVVLSLFRLAYKQVLRTCMKPPITPYVSQSSLFRVTMAGIIVWYGRLPVNPPIAA